MIPLDTSKRAARMLAAGRVTLTAKCRKPDERTGRWGSCPLAEAKIIFIEVPNDQGWNDKVGKITRARGFQPDPRADEARVFCAKQLFHFLAGNPTATGLEIFEESSCGRCGRALTDPVSIERGIGPECYGRMTGSQHETKVAPTPAACTCDNHQHSSGSLDCPQHGADNQRAAEEEQRGEIDAENAWLRAAEAGSPQDWAEEQQEREMAAFYGDGEGEITGDMYGAFDAAGHDDGQAHATTSNGDGKDKQNVPYGYGDWRGRKRAAKQIRGATSQRETSPACHQMAALPGETWTDIFRPRAVEMGLTLPA